MRQELPALNRRIPTIARTEMGMAADEGAKASMVNSEVVTHCSVIGCESSTDHPTLGINCNIENVPIEDVDKIEFHINHTGTWIPSKFKSTDDIIREVVEGRSFAIKSPWASATSKEMYYKDGYDTNRISLHNSIANRIIHASKNNSDKEFKLICGLPNTTRNSSVGIELDYKFVLDSLSVGKESTKDSFYIDEANDVSTYIHDIIVASEFSFSTFQVTGGNILDYIGLYKENGFTANGEYHIPNLMDYISGKGDKMPDYLVRSMIYTNSKNVISALEKGFFDELKIFSNDQLIFEYKDGEVIKIIDNKFANFYLYANAEKYLKRNRIPFLGKYECVDVHPKSEVIPYYHAQNILTEILNGIDESKSVYKLANNDYFRARRYIEDDITRNEYKGVLIPDPTNWDFQFIL